MLKFIAVNEWTRDPCTVRGFLRLIACPLKHYFPDQGKQEQQGQRTQWRLCHMSKDTTILIGSKIAGVVRGDVLDIRKSITHFCRKHGGDGFSPVTLDRAEELGAKEIQVTITESGKVYRCTIDELRRYSIPDNLGAGLQFFMPLSYFKYCQAHRPELHKNEPVPLQFSMFG